MEYVILYIPFVIYLAWDNAKRIKQDKVIHHWINGGLHLLVAGLVFIFYGWQLSLALLLLVRVVFDTALNLFRGLPVFHLPLNPKSIIDKIENKIFKHGFMAKFIYSIIAILLLCSNG